MNLAYLTARRSVRAGTLVLLSLFGVAGCMHGPFKLGKYMPIYQSEWKQDESYGPSIHNKLEDLNTLSRIGPTLSPEEQERAAQELLDRFREESSVQLASQMVRTVSALSGPSSLECLRLAIRHRDSSVRIAACEGWAKKANEEGLQILSERVGGDTDLDVRIAAARSLEKFRDPAAIRALGVALDDHDPALQFRAVQSLKKITGKDYGDNVPAWREFVQGGQANPQPAETFANKFRGLF